MTTDSKQHAAAPVQALLGRELGMIQAWDVDGCLVPLTTVQVGINVVTQVRTEEVDGCNIVQPRFDEIPVRKVTKSMAGHFAKVDVEPRHHLAEIRTSATNSYELGQELQATVFKTDQAVDASGNTKGKSSMDVMKRHGSAGISASHDAHRNRHKSGSTGACATPGRIFKGLCMADRMGNIHRTAWNLKIQAMDAKEGLLPISGAIPGPKNGVVLARSSVKGT